MAQTFLVLGFGEPKAKIASDTLYCGGCKLSALKILGEATAHPRVELHILGTPHKRRYIADPKPEPEPESAPARATEPATSPEPAPEPAPATSGKPRAFKLSPGA